MRQSPDPAGKNVPVRGSRATAAGAPTRGRSAEPGHDVLDGGVVLDGLGAHALAVARLPKDAVGRLRDRGDVVVDPDCPETQPAGRVEARRYATCLSLSLATDSIHRFLVGVAETVEGGFVEGAADELQPDGEVRGRGAAGHREAGQTVYVGRAREAGEGRVYGLIVVAYLRLALPDLRRRDRDRRGDEHVYRAQRVLELSPGAQLPLPGVRVPEGLEPLAVEQPFETLIVELFGGRLQALLVHGVGLRGQDEPLRVQGIPQLGNLDLPHLCAERREDLGRLPYARLDIPIEVFEVEA